MLLMAVPWLSAAMASTPPSAASHNILSLHTRLTAPTVCPFAFASAVDPKSKAVRHHWAESKRGNNVVHSGRSLQAPNSTYAMQVVKTTDVSRT